MARVWGANAKVTTGLTAHSTLRTYSIWTYRTGNGGGGGGRMFEKRVGGSQVEVLLNRADFDGVYAYSRSFTGENQWFFTRPSANTWVHIAVVYDSSNSANEPVIYVGGSSVVITKYSDGTGSAATNTDAYVIGNRGSDNARGWAGRLCEFAIWDALLTADEIASLAKGFSAAMVRPTALKCYVPLLGEGLQDWRGAVCTQNNTTVVEHPKIIYPAQANTVFYSIPSGITFNPAWAAGSNQVLYV